MGDTPTTLSPSCSGRNAVVERSLSGDRHPKLNLACSSAFEHTHPSQNDAEQHHQHNGQTPPLTPMNLDEFESRYEELIDEALNQLQSIVLYIQQLESPLAAAESLPPPLEPLPLTVNQLQSVTYQLAASLQRLTHTVEQFIGEQRQP